MFFTPINQIQGIMNQCAKKKPFVFTDYASPELLPEHHDSKIHREVAGRISIRIMPDLF